VISPNAKALLDTIALAEGTSGAQGYNTMFTHRTFGDLSRHPRQINRSNGYASDAAGRYQFLSTTWDGVAKELGLKDFSPASQDLAALQLVRRRGVDPDKPLTRETLAKLAPEWASLPTLQGASYYGQPVKAADKLLLHYQERLGGGGQAAAPSEAPAAAAPTPASPQPGFSLRSLAAGVLGGGGGTGSFRMADPFSTIPKAASTGTGDSREVADAILGSGFARTAGKQRMAASSALLPGLIAAATDRQAGRYGVSLDDILPAMKAASALAAPQPTPGLQVPQMGSAPAAQAPATPRQVASSGEMVDMVTLGTMLQDQAKLRVREHSKFGGVGGHSPGSLHYKDEAFDVTDWKDPGESQASWLPRKKYLEQRFTGILGSAGEIYGPVSDPKGHGTHIHLGVPGGRLPLSMAQQLVQARMESLQKYPLRWAG
jgi:muramidase (phage lysozyme)